MIQQKLFFWKIVFQTSIPARVTKLVCSRIWYILLAGFHVSRSVWIFSTIIKPSLTSVFDQGVAIHVYDTTKIKFRKTIFPNFDFSSCYQTHLEFDRQHWHTSWCMWNSTKFSIYQILEKLVLEHEPKSKFEKLFFQNVIFVVS